MGLMNWIGKEKDKETRSQLTNNNWWKTVFAGAETFSGETVTQDSALHQPAVFACVRVISEDVASLPIKIYSCVSEMVREPINTHPVAKLFHTAPNPEMTPFTFKETMTAHVLLYGNAYAEIERNGAGDPIGLWILAPEKMAIDITDGKVWYVYNGQARIASENILHIKGLGHDGIQGYSPIGYARETIGMSQAMEKSGGTFFANSSRPSGVLSHPAKLSEDAAKRLRQGWDGMYSGSGNLGKTAILEESMSWQSLSIPHSDAQWLEARQYALQDICRIYRMPPHMVQDLSNATYSNIESQQIQYMQGTLMPWLRRWEEEISRKLLGVDDRSIYAEFLAEEALRGNTIDRYAAYRTARESGWLSINEIRKRENLNTIGEEGDKYIMPLNFSDVDAEVIEDEVREQPKPPDNWLVDSVRRAVAIVRNASNRTANKDGNEDWEIFVQGDVSLCKKVESILEPCCRNMGLNEKVVGNELVNTWKSAVANADTQTLRVDACDNWAKSFLNSESAAVLIQRSKESE